ncbi:heparinase II/III family protein [Chitinophaga sp. YIM B06452]|uniref:heparinase II/III domain-containing protein n=1 Tax=Chitinophaga sp. YIM B06452 TaxID=3082158 RepID=UPI0031FE7487
MKKTLVLLAFLLPVFTYAQDHQKLLTRSYSEAQLSGMLVNNQDWVTLPPYSDRAFWDGLPASIRSELIKRGEDQLKFNWGVVKATDYMEFTRTGDRNIMQNPNSDRKGALQALALAELVEGKGRFTDQLINGIWAVCEQSSWVLSAHLPVTRGKDLVPDVTNPVIDLGSADAGALLAWVHHFFRAKLDEVNPLIAARIRYEVRNKILAPYYKRNDFWWQGFNDRPQNNWNPWINYNVMQCILLLEEDPAARSKNIYKAMQSIDRFTDWYHPDGACDEGPSYWSHAGGKYFECLELLHRATRGKLNVFSHPLIKNIGQYIANVYINDPYFVNFADASAKGGINEGMVYRYGKAIGDPVMMGFGAFYAQKEKMDEHPSSGTIEAVITDLTTMKEIMASPAREPLTDHAWYPDNQVAIAREYPGSKQGFYFAGKGGHNAESHNHNDVGTFILYYNGLPCLVDAGVGTYVRQTFSPDRYKIWTMQSAYHNLPLINGVQQKNGREFKAASAAFSATAKQVSFTADIATAYPAEAKVRSWKRGYALQRGKSFTITDAFVLDSFVAAPELHFLTACKVDASVPGVIKLTGQNFTLNMSYNTRQLEASSEHIDNKDPRLERSWPGGLERIILKGKTQGVKGDYKIEIRKSS